MSPTSLALVLSAALLHTAWNLMLKRSPDRQMVSWLGLLVGALIFAPAVALAWPLPAAVWPYIIASAVVEVAYMTLLSRAYQHGDFSLVYPVARGTAPVLLAVWAAIFLGDHPSAGGLVGLALLVAGLAVIGVGHWWASRGAAHVGWGGVGLALAVAAMISTYSTIDAAGVRLADPLAYNTIVMALTGLLMTPLALRGGGWAAARTALRRSWRTVVLIGVLMLTTYALVLQAYAVSTASYVGAVREVSIVFAAIIGWRLLGESFGRARVAGAALAFCGVLVIALLGN